MLVMVPACINFKHILNVKSLAALEVSTVHTAMIITNHLESFLHGRVVLGICHYFNFHKTSKS